MSGRRILTQVIIISYLLITTLAFKATMTHHFFSIPILGHLEKWSYGMMAPYQGDNWYNSALYAEGTIDGETWKEIDLNPYFPVEFGEKNVRMHLRSFALGKRKKQKFHEFAVQLQEKEEERGRSWKVIQLRWQEWPRSPGGFSYLRREPFFTENRIIAITP